MQILQIGTIVWPLTLTAEVTMGLCAFIGHVGVLKREHNNVAATGPHVKSHPDDASMKCEWSEDGFRVPGFRQNGPLKIGQSGRCMNLQRVNIWFL